MEKCKTLGNETYFKFSLDENNKLSLSYGNSDQINEVPNEMIIKVLLRVENIKAKSTNELRKVGNYSLTNWSACPNTVLCPYIAKLIIDVFDNESINFFKSNN